MKDSMMINTESQNLNLGNTTLGQQTEIKLDDIQNKAVFTNYMV